MVAGTTNITLAIPSALTSALERYSLVRLSVLDKNRADRTTCRCLQPSLEALGPWIRDYGLPVGGRNKHPWGSGLQMGLPMHTS
jgi:hypothetical protein